MPKPFISVHDLCMDFDDTRVLNKVSFEIPEGEIMGVIGQERRREERAHAPPPWR